MAELDAILEKYTNPRSGSVHGATFVAVDCNGNDIYRKAFGHRQVNTGNSPVLTADTVTWIASQTKLTSSVAVMQVVERGLIGLDDDVCAVLPQLQELKVLIGFEGEDGVETGLHVDLDAISNHALQNKKPQNEKRIAMPILEDVKGPITLRQLITHTSGFCYDLGNPLLRKYSAWAGRKENMFSGTLDGNFHPLIFQPGTSWQYGPGLDWAGQVVSKLTGMSYDEYQRRNIWEPLGAKSTTFFPKNYGLTRGDIHEMAHRAQGEGSQNLRAGPSPWEFHCADALGGGGLYSTANDYSKLLTALLAGGGPLLSKDSVNELFRPQIGPDSMVALRDFIIGTGVDNTKSWLWTQSLEEWRDVMELEHCLCGIVTTEDVKRRRRKNTVSWDGLPNLLWFIDRRSGVAATLFTQVMPVVDLPVRHLWLELEEALYRIVDQR